MTGKKNNLTTIPNDSTDDTLANKPKIERFCKDLDIPTYKGGDGATINKAVKAYAKELFMNYVTIPEIAKRTGIPYRVVTLNAYAHNNQKAACWKQERELFAGEILANFSEAKRPGLTSILTNSIYIIERAMEDLMAPNRKITPDDALKVVKIYDSLDRIMRLDSGSATNIVQQLKPSSVIDIRRKIKEKMEKDPFYQVEDASFKEIDNGKEIDSSDSSNDDELL